MLIIISILLITSGVILQVLEINKILRNAKKAINSLYKDKDQIKYDKNPI